MLDKNILEKTLRKINRVRVVIIVISIILSITAFILRDYCGWNWCDYCLFLLPYGSTSLYYFHKQILLKKNMFAIDTQKPQTMAQIELSTLDCLSVIIKYLQL